MADEMVEVDVSLVRESDASWLVRDEDDGEVWLPKSRVDFPGGCREGAVVTLEVPRWIADDRGLAY